MYEPKEEMEGEVALEYTRTKRQGLDTFQLTVLVRENLVTEVGI